MTLLNIENIYPARFKEAGIATACGRKGRGGSIRAQNYRALNFELEVLDDAGHSIGTIHGGVPATQTTTYNSPLIRFFKSLGIFRNPNEFDPKELVGMEVQITVNNVCDSQMGLRSVVDQFFPKMM